MSYENIFIDGPISTEKIANSIASHQSKTNIGAHSIFLGQVRADETNLGAVSAIEYTAYNEMALELAHGIREDIFSKYDLTCMHIYHSLGKVEVGEMCLFVFTSSKRRKAAIDACSELVERIKNELPIWGKELMDTNQENWKINQ